jgi:hypothetical protein
MNKYAELIKKNRTGIITLGALLLLLEIAINGMETKDWAITTLRGVSVGAVIFLVLFIPYGIVGTWRAKAFGRQQGWQRLLTMSGIKGKQEEEEVAPPDTPTE